MGRPVPSKRTGRLTCEEYFAWKEAASSWFDAALTAIFELSAFASRTTRRLGGRTVRADWRWTTVLIWRVNIVSILGLARGR